MRTKQERVRKTLRWFLNLKRPFFDKKNGLDNQDISTDTIITADTDAMELLVMILKQFYQLRHNIEIGNPIETLLRCS